jgi:hypothetical protein
MEQFEVGQVIQILENNSDLNLEFARTNFILVPHYLSGDTIPRFSGDTFLGNFYLTKYGYTQLAEYYLDNKTTFVQNKVATLASATTITSAFWNIITDIRSTPNGYGTPLNEFGTVVGFNGSILAKWIMYVIKYSAVKTFFRQNYEFFVPEFDYTMMNSENKTKLFQEAFMREFDKFSMVIDNLANVVDIDKIPENDLTNLDGVTINYLNYLAQVIGYERGDYQLLTNSSFRELLKNIIEIYKIKGTNYSFELFFNLLGFEIIPQEFWFDKRYGDTSITSNPYTLSTNRGSYQFYLTPYKPTEVMPKGISKTYSITQNSIVKTMDLNKFDRLATAYSDGDSIGYSPYQLTGNISINLSYKLKGHWPLNEGIGDTTIDLSSSRCRLTTFKTQWKRVGVENGPQIYFEDRGDTKFVRSSSSINFIQAKEMSLTFWAKKEGGDSAVAFTFGRGDNEGIYLLTYLDGGGIIRFSNAGAHEDVVIPSGVFDNNLRFYAFTFNSASKKVCLYKNSVRVINVTISIATKFPNRQLFFGNYWPTLPSTGWIGSLEEIRLYDRQLSEYEVKQLYSPIGDTYTYFKTNSIQYSIASLRTGQEINLSAADLTSISFYADFLTPIFVNRNILFKAKTIYDNVANEWSLLDNDREDPMYFNGGDKSFSILSIDARAGDTFFPRGKVIVSDPRAFLISNIHPTGDSGVGKYVVDRVKITGTSAVSNDGYYYIASDTVAPYYNSSSKQTTIYLKGDTNVGLHGTSKTIPNGTLFIGGPDKMFHLYEGRPPKWYYADSGLIGDSKPPKGGNFISGFFTDNRDTIYGIDTPNSIYYRQKILHPDYSEEQIFALMRSYFVQGDPGYIFLGVTGRDFFNVIDSTRNMKQGHYQGTNIVGDTGRSTADSWIIYNRSSAIKYSNVADSNKVWWRYGGFITVVPKLWRGDTILGNKIAFSANMPMRTWDARPNESYLENYNVLQTKRGDTTYRDYTGQIFHINANNGLGQAVIRITDRKKKIPGDSFRRFKRLVKDDYITLYDTVDENNRVTRKVFSVAHGDTTTAPGVGDTVTITVTGVLPGRNQVNIAKGYIDFEQVRKVKKLTRGTVKGSIALFDGSQLFRNLKSGDTIQLVDTGDTNEGIYIADSAGHFRISGDSGVTTIILKSILNGANSDSRGMVRLYSNYWTMGNSRYTFMLDKFSVIQNRKVPIII